MQIETISDFRKAMRHGKYAWPGGYPVYFIMSDGEALAFDSAKAQRRSILEALADYKTNPHEHSGWRPVALEINHEDNELFCAHTGEQIEAAYSNHEERELYQERANRKDETQ